MLKKTLSCAVAGALLAACSTGLFAAEAEIYGLIDEGFKLMRSGGENTFEMNPGQIAGSRVGLRVKETISPDLKLYVNLENGFDADTGEMADSTRLFNRNSVLGIETPYGTLEAGRTGALVAGVTGGIFAGKVSPFGITWQEAQSSQILSGAVSTRVDNTLRYESPKLAGFNLYAQVSNGIAGDDSVQSSRKDRYAAVGATYKNGPFMAVLVVDRMFTKNASESSAFLGDDYTTVNLGGTYDFGPVKLFLAYQYGDGVTRVGKISSSVKGSNTGVDREEHTTGYDTHAVLLGANIDLFGGTLKTAGGYVKGDRDYNTFRNDGSLRYKNSDDVEGWQLGIGYLYPLSKRTDLYAGAAYVHAKNWTDSDQIARDGSLMSKSDEGTNESTRSFIFGMRHRF